MKNQKTKGLISLAVMVALTLVLVFCTDSIYSKLTGVATYTPANSGTEAPVQDNANQSNQTSANQSTTNTDTTVSTDIADGTDGLAAELQAAIANANGNYVPGTYEATADGCMGPVTVKITVSDKAITDVQITGEAETPTIGGVAMETLAPQIIIAQSAEVDAMANATLTSNGIIKAAKDALAQAAASGATSDAAVKTGIGFAISQSSSSDATAEKDGTAQTDATVAAVTVDADGKVTACAIDVAQTKVKFSSAGAITTDASGEFLSKQELGTAYGMGAFSGIQKEWYEQADAFAAYCVGKTAAEINAIQLSAGAVDASVDLAASCTIHVTDFIVAVTNAIDNATDCGASASDKIGIGISTNISSSKDATAEANGLAQAYSTFSVVTKNADGQITSSLLDAVQSNVSFDAEGKITSDTTSGAMTKNQLKENYGMKTFSPIQKEWYEQAAAYAQFVVGKDAAGLSAIKVENGYAAEPDLAASCTIHVTDFNSAIAKAINNAK